ncbi:MAG: 50S ribosomal protein L37 [archaeon]|nr:50S ribosomal protein L37 [archaeon]MCP8320899.1 50S ribosomal protein L37 [archaeon]
MPKAKGRGLKGLSAKYGSTLRKRHGRVFSTLKMRRNCPSCGSWKLKRKSKGIWECKSCGLVITGRAYDIAPTPIKPA